MNLTNLFEKSIGQAENLIELYIFLNNLKLKNVRAETKDKVFGQRLASWPRSQGLSRLVGHEVLLFGSPEKIDPFNESKEQNEKLILRSAFVLALAAFDKLMHEIVLKKFSKFCAAGHLDTLIKLDISISYKIAQLARDRTGKGGKKRKRPGNNFKKEVSEILFMKPFLAPSEIERIFIGLGGEKIWDAFGKSFTPNLAGSIIRSNWNKLYQRRNHIAHELDIKRSLKPKIISFREITLAEVKEALALTKNLGNFILSMA